MPQMSPLKAISYRLRCRLLENQAISKKNGQIGYLIGLFALQFVTETVIVLTC